MPINKCEGGFLCLLLKSERDPMPINRCKTRKDIHKCKVSSQYTSYVKVSSNPLIIHLNTIVTKMQYQMVKSLPIMLGKVTCEEPITAKLGYTPNIMNGQVQGHSMILRSGATDSINIQKKKSCSTQILMTFTTMCNHHRKILSRKWSRKCHNLCHPRP